MIYQLLFIVIPIIYLLFERKRNEELEGLSFIDSFKEYFKFRSLNLSTIKRAAVIAFTLIVILIIISQVKAFFMPDLTDTSVVSFIEDNYKILGFNFFILIFISVFAEELFFRSFLVRHFGVFMSSLFFALMHLSYSSIIQFIGAFLMGIALALFWKEYKDFFTLFLGHLLYNLFIIALVLM